jgi:FdrA protein
VINALSLHEGRYLDSIVLLTATRVMREVAGIQWATAVMATPANVEGLRREGIDDDRLAGASANDLVLAVRADGPDGAAAALAAGDGALAGPGPAAGPRSSGAARRTHRVLDEALASLPDANVAIVSVPGPFAALEAHKALHAGLHVLLFSDNVTVDDEVALKDHAASVGRLLMGPGAGTAVLGGCGLGFANVVRPGPVGVVAAAGTGAQEVMTLLDWWGVGVSQVIGVGGRDLSEAVNGRMAKAAVRSLDQDPATDVILLVSKPPSPEVARAVVAEAKTTPIVAALVGLAEGIEVPGAVAVCSTLEGGAVAAVVALGLDKPDPTRGLVEDVRRAVVGLQARRTLVSGLFSGGTLCYEALTLLQPWLGPVWSNTPLDKAYLAPAPPGGHLCLDLGEEEYTKGRPHPMIDPQARLDLLGQVRSQPDTAVVLLDVVLGYGAHDDPAAELAAACADVCTSDGPRVVVYVLGTEADPQDIHRQRQCFREAGCLVAPTGARAALAAAAIAVRRPEVAEAEL